MVGRDGLLDDLEAAGDAAAEGIGSVVLLLGEAGIGKTTVVHALARSVREELSVTWGSCLADGSAPPFWPWRGLIDLKLSDEPRETDGAVGATRFELLTALGDQLRALAFERPRLHIIEDLQWADVASVLLLVHLAATVADVAFLVVATLRTGEHSASQLDDAIGELRRTAQLRDLPALGDRDVATLIRSSGAEPDDRLVALVRTRTSGNPLFVNELLRAVPRTETAERRREILAERVPERVADLVLHRLGRLPASVADALVTASVVGADGDVAILAGAHDCEVEPLLDLLEQARAAQFLDAAAPGRWQFRHQLIRDAVYASAAASDRARRHLLVLDALAADPSVPPTVIAHHALAAQPLIDAERASLLAESAGDSAFVQHAYEEAVGWFSRALAAAPDRVSRRRAELLVHSGEAHRHIGDVEAARRAFLQAAESTDDPALLARAALGYADPGADLGIAFRTDDAVTAELLDRAIEAQPSLDSVTAVQLQARLGAELYFSDEPSRARELASSALDRAARLHDERALVAAHAVMHDAFVVGQADPNEQLQGSAQLLEWARASGSVSALLTAHRARVLDLLAAGEMAAVDAEILAFRRLADPLRAPSYSWWPEIWSAMRALLEGRHEVAEERALAAYETGAGPFAPLAFNNLAFLLFFLRREQGRLDEMEQATRDYAVSHADIPALRVAHTFLLAELGRVDEARGALAALDDVAFIRLHDRNWPASWFQLARAASVVGDHDLAAKLLAAETRPRERCVQVSLATVCLGATDLAVAWLLHTVGDLDDADEHYRSAEEINARVGARCWLAQTRGDHARLLFERDGPGDRDAAVRLQELAARAAREIGLATVTVDAPNNARATAPAVFRRQGSIWELGFASRVARLPDARGMNDLAYLLSRPGEAVSVLELASDPGAGPTARGAPALDERARREIRERLHELDGDEAEAEAIGDTERAALAREQRQLLAEAVARDFGLHGRARRVGDPVERARKTVSTRIRRTIAVVGRHHPELGRHLERSIDTGTWCAYRPAEPVDWLT